MTRRSFGDSCRTPSGPRTWTTSWSPRYSVILGEKQHLRNADLGAEDTNEREHDDDPQRRTERHGQPGSGDAEVDRGVPAGPPDAVRDAAEEQGPHAVPATTQASARPVVSGE
jgi:hypothetical protein